MLIMRASTVCILLGSLFGMIINSECALRGRKYKVVHTAQTDCYKYSGNPLASCPATGEPFCGQDAQFTTNAPQYTDNGDGTISDDVTGLMWVKDPGEKLSLTQAEENVANGAITVGGHTDWRVPTIKEIYSLIQFTGYEATSEADAIPFIDTDYFTFSYGKEEDGDRWIDSQMMGTRYVGATMRGDETMFGVNFADGRIKGYPLYKKNPRSDNVFYCYYVRGVTNRRGKSLYGLNKFRNNGDDTVSDLATGLMWMQKDSGHLGAGPDGDGKMNWEQALSWADSLEYAGHSDWRLPTAKELQSIVDYTRSPQTNNSAAIDPIFEATQITDEGGNVNWGWYWTGTTHLTGPPNQSKAVYLAFGEALGWMDFGQGYELVDVHGAGAQRSDPKQGDPADYPNGFGPQNDVIRIYNFVRLVRDI